MSLSQMIPPKMIGATWLCFWELCLQTAWISQQGDDSAFHLPRSPCAAFGCSSRGRRMALGAVPHVFLVTGQCTEQRTEQSLQVPLEHCGCIQLSKVFAFCFQVLAWVCPSLFNTACIPPWKSALFNGEWGSRIALCVQFLCKKPRWSTNYLYHMYICISDDHIPSAILERV